MSQRTDCHRYEKVDITPHLCYRLVMVHVMPFVLDIRDVNRFVDAFSHLEFVDGLNNPSMHLIALVYAACMHINLLLLVDIVHTTCTRNLQLLQDASVA